MLVGVQYPILLNDPHIWHDPANVKAMNNTIAWNIKPLFDANGDAAIGQRRNQMNRVLDSLGNWIGQQVAAVPERQRVLVTGHRAFLFSRVRDSQVPVLDDYTTGGTLRPSSLSAISKASNPQVVKPSFLILFLPPKQ